MVAISGNGGLSNTPISNYTRDQGWGMGSAVGAIPSIIGGREIRLSHVGKVFPISQESLRQVARTGLQFAPMGRSNIKQTLGACVDPTSVGEATSTEENVRLPFDNAYFNVVIAWHCRDGLPLHASNSCSAWANRH